MFGYAVCDKDELKLRQYKKYSAHYCGVCKAIKKRFGITCCAMLNYDCASLALAADICAASEYSQERCLINPLKKVSVARGSANDYAAAVNVFLGVGKLEDDWRDDKNPVAFAGAAFLKRAKQRAEAMLGAAAADATAALSRLLELEKQGSASIDDTSQAFGDMLGTLFENAPAGDEYRPVYKNLGFNLGKWIYLIDAADDMQKDEKSGKYNVFLKRYGSMEAALKDIQSVEYNLLAPLSQAGAVAELLPDNDSLEILLNIIDGGARKKTAVVLRQEDK